jgi:hypothetical protein
MARTWVRRGLTLVAAAALGGAGLFAFSGTAGAQPTGFVIVDTGGGCQLGQIDLTSGAVSNLLPASPSLSVCSADLAFGPDGTLYGVNGGNLVKYNTGTGATSVIGPLGVTALGGEAEGLTFDAAGHLWAALLTGDSPCVSGLASGATSSSSTPTSAGVHPAIFVNNCLYQVDPASGHATFVSQFKAGTLGNTAENVTGLAGACDGRVLTDYRSFAPPPGVAPVLILASVNTTDAQLTDIGGNGDSHHVNSIDFAPETAGTPQPLYGVGTSTLAAQQVFLMNQSTGAAAVVTTATGLPGGSFLVALAIGPISCPPVIVVQPKFTG